jgi:putative tryptophan/tyrosine transport system substrate-binding protein
MASRGFTEGQNLAIEYRRIDQGEPAAFAGAAELIRWKADVLVATGAEISLKAAIAASPSVPIVFTANNYDPIGRGYVKSLAQPGGNFTGLFYRQPELAGKQLELLAEAFPDRTRVGAFWDSFSADQFSMADSTANALRLELRAHKLENPPYDFAAAFRETAQKGAQMLLVLSSPHLPRIAGRSPTLRFGTASRPCSS